MTTPTPTVKPARRRLSTPKKLAFAFFFVVFAICALEGFAHFVTFAIDYPRWAKGQNRIFNEKAHRAIQFDAQLGWVLTPNVRDPDYFGRGIGLTVNSQGIRALRDYAPASNNRILMLGDSFAFGHGVGDSETFPARVEAAAGVETVNLALMGYGMDQAYLAYSRFESRLEHQAVLFGIITDDFRRMMVDRLGDGHFKPRLELRSDRLVTVGVPVPTPLPQGGMLYPELRWRFIGDYFAVSRLLPLRPKPGEFSVLDRPEESEALAERLFLDLDQRLKTKGRRLAIVWFPALYEFSQPPMRELFQYHLDAMKDFTRANGIPLIDLTGSLPGKTEAEYQQSYLPYEIDPWRHPTARAHEIFAQAALPQIRKLLAGSAAAGK